MSIQLSKFCRFILVGVVLGQSLSLLSCKTRGSGSKAKSETSSPSEGSSTKVVEWSVLETIIF